MRVCTVELSYFSTPTERSILLPPQTTDLLVPIAW